MSRKKKHLKELLQRLPPPLLGFYGWSCAALMKSIPHLLLKQSWRERKHLLLRQRHNTQGDGMKSSNNHRQLSKK